MEHGPERIRRVFLSHGLADSKLAQELAQALSDVGLEVVQPENRILAGNNFAMAIASALKSTDGMVVMLTPETVESPLLEREVSYALKRPRFKNRVVPVLAPKTKSYPWILNRLRPIQITGNLHLAANRVADRLAEAKPRNAPTKKVVAA